MYSTLNWRVHCHSYRGDGGEDKLRPRCPLSMDCGRMSNEAEYMNLDVENKTSKVETCIVDLLIKVAENRQLGMPNS